MDEVTAKAWEVFRSAFRDGDDVVVERSDGKFFWGKLTAEATRVVVVQPSGLRRIVRWDEVEFIAHDGFPVGRLMRMTPEEAARRAEQTPREIIEDALLNRGMVAHTEFDGSPEYGYILDEHGKALPVSFGGGCPFVAGPCEIVAVHNRGNIGPAFWREDDGEVVVAEAADGALMHSYDTDHLFLNF